MKIKKIKKLFLILTVLIYTSFAYSSYNKNDIVVSFLNDGETTITINQVIVTQKGCASIENGARILPGEELTVGTNVREFIIKIGNRKYKITVPLNEIDQNTITLRISTIKTMILGIIAKELY